ncbi:MAG: aldehyde-activating protein [Novosphingobium sp. 32-60-15]|uniref:GFA family protein n=1 Tax=unclassified Novosphingobium TaxID=2644732 RepID=UPI000BCBA71D|nr:MULTISPECIES: GFA family protein [unclassified Novosphingobium]OYX61769.1 MAG: aldehyde-activating protein [Novosphingobium sp. 32-60-15]
MEHTGGCQCGSVRYAVSGDPMHVAICHCIDCRKSTGAPMVAWAMFTADQFALTQGEVTTFNSSGASMRNFCPRCGTGLFFTNADNLPGIIDVQAATLDDPDALPAQVHIQTAERIGWMAQAHTLPEFARFPGPE